MRILLPVLGIAVIGTSFAAQKPQVKSFNIKRTGYWDLMYSYFKFPGSSPIVLLANESVFREARRNVNMMFRDVSTANMGKKPDIPATLEATPGLSFQGKDLISASTQVTTYTGGVHPNTNFLAYNFGLVGGKPARLRLSSLFSKGVDGLAVVSKLVIAKLKKTEGAYWVKDGEVKQMSAEQGDRYAIAKDGLTFIFDPYEMGPYSSGTIRAKVAFSELKGKLVPKGPLRSLLKK